MAGSAFSSVSGRARGRQSHPAVPKSGTETATGGCGSAQRRGFRSQPARKSNGTSRNATHHRLPWQAPPSRAFLGAREAAKVTLLCPSRAPKRRRGGVVAPNVVVSGHSRRGNLMERPVMRRTIDFRGRLRLLERFWAPRGRQSHPAVPKSGTETATGGCGSAQRRGFRSQPVRKSNGTSRNAAHHRLPWQAPPSRAFLGAREAAKVTLLCPSRAPKRRRGGVAAPNVVVSGHSRRGNLMERPVMRRTKDFRGRLRLLERFWARARPPKSPCCAAQVGHRNGDGGVW